MSIFQYKDEDEEVTRDESAEKQDENDPSNLANPTELKGGNTTGPGEHSGTPSEV